MSENVVINDTTYNGVDTLALVRSDGNVATFYPDAVRYNAQNLTEEQKAQARENIGVDASNAIEPAEDDIPKVFFGAALPQTKDDTIMSFRYISKTEDISVYCVTKAQGGSSMDYPKKNQNTKLYKDAECTEKMKVNFKGWGEQNKFCFKANWVDHSHARNIVCANLWSDVVASRPDYDSLPEEMRNSPNNGAIDGFPVKLYANGVYQGIYTLNIPKDAWMWNMDEDNPDHILLCGEANTDNTVTDYNTATNFRELWTDANAGDWEVEVGENSDAIRNSLNALISCVKDTDDDTFKATLGNYLDVQSALDYYLFVQVIMGQDSLARNMLLATYNGAKWYCGAYDLDNTWGWATGKVPEDCTETHSLLWSRIENLFSEELKARYVELRDSVFSYSNLIDKVERFMDKIGTELYAEDLTVFPDIPAGTNDTIAGFRDIIVKRRPVIDAEVGSWGINEYLYVLPEATTFGGSTTMVDTGVVLFDEPKDFTIFVDVSAGNEQSNDCWLIGGDYTLDQIFRVQSQSAYAAVYVNGIRQKTDDEINGMWGHTWERLRYMVLVFKDGVFQFGKYTKNGTVLGITASDGLEFRKSDTLSTITLGSKKSMDGTSISNYWKGTINDFRIYNRALTEDETIALMNEVAE